MLSKFNLLTLQELSNGVVGREEAQALRNSFCGFDEPRAAGASQGGASNAQSILSTPTRAGPLHHCSQGAGGGGGGISLLPLIPGALHKLRKKPDAPGLRGSLDSAKPPLDSIQGSSMKLAAALPGLALMLRAAAALQICTFNIRSFGDTKLSDRSVSKIIVKILSRYDLVLVQEVRDADLSAVQELLARLNRASKHSYDYVTSESLGRENYREMYLFLYRTQSFSLVDQYQYPNPDSTFSRPPFIVKFAASSSKKELVLVPLHTPPSEAVAEIDALYDVYLKIIDKWQTDNIMFLGDFNADCSYVGKKDWSSIRLRTSEVFHWLISDDTDTTVGNSDCAYDRIVVSGSKLRKWIVPKSAKVFDFQRAFKLSQEEALAVSDHFPVEVELTSP